MKHTHAIDMHIHTHPHKYCLHNTSTHHQSPDRFSHTYAFLYTTFLYNQNMEHEQKYMVEAFYEKELKVEKKKAYYSKLVKQPWGVVDYYPPKERLDYEKIKNLSKQKWIRKFPPLAALGEDTYRRLKNHAQVEYFAYGVEDFALHLPQNLVPSRRVLVLRYKNRFDTLVQSLVMKGNSKAT